MTTRYKVEMTPDQFIDLAFEISCEEVLEYAADGRVPCTVATFSELHDYMDANCLAGLCDDSLGPIFEAIFGREGDDTGWFSDGFIAAVNTLQDRVHQWIVSGGVAEGLAQQQEFNGAAR